MAKIAIDARLWGLNNTGLGRYTMRLITGLSEIDSNNEYHLLVRKELFENPPVLSHNFHLHQVEARHYSFTEQWLVPQVLSQIKPDILHVPHFNIPIFWTGKIIVTIHDLIKQSSVGTHTTTLPSLIYWFKWLVHQFVIWQAVRRSKVILVPSQFTKQQLIDHYRADQAKIKVTYEAPDPLYYKNMRNAPNILVKILRVLQKKPPETSITHVQEELLKKNQIVQPFIIYTGNAYPHKNLMTLLTALKTFNHSAIAPLQLVIVCARDSFHQRLEEHIVELKIEQYVKLIGFVEDDELRELYRLSLAFVTPSLIEGFGLPGLEAFAAGTLVISAQASCLPEIYRDKAFYFSPHEPSELVEKLQQVSNLNPAKRNQLINAGIKHSQTYSWQQLARQTHQSYEEVLK